MKALGVREVLVLMALCYTLLSFWCCEGCLEEERRSLLQIQASMRNATDPTAFSSWKGNDCCQWYMIRCSTTSSRVIEIYLADVGELGRRSWQLNASLFAEFKELKEIDLTNTRVTGSDLLQGFCELKHLRKLAVRDNFLTGVIPSCFGNLSSLQELDLSTNALTGSIPSSIFNNLTKIQKFDVSHNKLHGVLPMSVFANCSKLSFLDLSYNSHLEVETESPTWLPSFQLVSLFLANCNLNKYSNSKIPSFIRSQSSLTILDLSFNSFTGNVPSWLLSNVTSHLRLRRNNFGGPFPLPSLNRTSKLASLDISENLFSGQIPNSIGTIFPRLYYLNASKNALLGSIPPSIGHLRDLQTLDLSNNKLSGDIPYNLNKCKRLLYLSLSSNKLKGQILPKESNFSWLSFLLLDDNAFTGIIPLELSNSPFLMVLNIRKNHLSGFIPSWISKFSDLGALLLGKNKMKGTIPREICQLQNLRFLDLYNNQISGNIPSCFNNISLWSNITATTAAPYVYYTPGSNGITVDIATKGRSYTYSGLPLVYMSGIDLSQNQMRGNIPVEMGELSALHSLDLSNNYFTGPLPSSFSSLESLEFLNISHNNLDGGIPPQLALLNFLSTFDVSFNNLSGSIPNGGQFSTYSCSSFVGNPGLWGEHLNRKCNQRNTPPSVIGDVGEEPKFYESDLFFYLFVATSYAIGFWGVIAALLLNKSWRVKFFRISDGYLENLC